ncbi:MAG: hypothetical protein HY401_10375 [Elusimicrobia bacterium]|nr:hypothetical protein [Elusimicrobiota bacterium]
MPPDPRTSPDGSPRVLAGPLSTTGFKGDSPALNPCAKCALTSQPLAMGSTTWPSTKTDWPVDTGGAGTAGLFKPPNCRQPKKTAAHKHKTKNRGVLKEDTRF